MIVGRTLLSTLARVPLVSYAQSQLLRQQQDVNLFLLVGKVSNYHTNKNIEYIVQSNQIKGHNRTIEQSDNVKNRPLLVLLSWLLSKRKHVMKYTNLYKEQGFDIVVVSVTPWQLLWPSKGTRLVAADLLDFLAKHKNYEQIFLHGFSVGAYMWGEVLDIMQSNPQKYNNIIDRIVGQVWDSVADVTELSIGIPRAVFPKNLVLQNMLQKYMEYHLKTFYKQSTQYYVRSSQLFHTNLVRTPALFLMSNTDPVGSVTSNMKVRDSWDSLGTKTYVKIFENSPHVGHYQKYPKEYVAELYAFLYKLNLIQNEERMRSHF
ncbi:transmembrane protein 53-like lethal (2) k09913 [Megachile rotundata]|uniref:transmembrane protein 53-like lethal (2) k09913 n=1 Tax=Megachile rotundata TaxID=143995 RepID=UPI000258DD96|nr:PREDICTED: transmembrane protein 53 [Megachile rotundata]XP_012136599.1 PREDICTED: transmembrane protein 53 [Megachile rotundata]